VIVGGDGDVAADRVPHATLQRGGGCGDQGHVHVAVAVNVNDDVSRAYCGRVASNEPGIPVRKLKKEPCQKPSRLLKSVGLLFFCWTS
jgi:hypothetical protein